MNCPFLTLTGRPVPAAASSRSVWRARKAGIWSRSTTSAIGRAWMVSWTSVVTGRPVSALIALEGPQPFVEARAAEARPGGPVGLVERGLEDQGDAAVGADLGQPGGDPQRHAAGFHHAGAGDQGQGTILSELRRADLHGVGRGHPRLLSHPRSGTLRAPLSVGRPGRATTAGGGQGPRPGGVAPIAPGRSYHDRPSLASGARAARIRQWRAGTSMLSAEGMTSTVHSAEPCRGVAVAGAGAGGMTVDGPIGRRRRDRGST